MGKMIQPLSLCFLFSIMLSKQACVCCNNTSFILYLGKSRHCMKRLLCPHCGFSRIWRFWAVDVWRSLQASLTVMSRDVHS